MRRCPMALMAEVIGGSLNSKYTISPATGAVSFR